jgi:outer membrane receptor protein involved in Fe transport
MQLICTIAKKLFYLLKNYHSPVRHVIYFIALFILVLCTGNAFAQNSLADTLQMQEVVIRSNNAISWHKDTTVYIADSFNHSQHNMAEDVLKKLPGVDVSIDGKITIEGKGVSRIFINGKEAGVNDIRNLTQNMPAYIIDRIQVADLVSEEARALGLKEASNEKIINLKLKDEYNNGLFGRAAAGGGNDELYQASLFSNYMADETRVTVMGYANNTGNADISNGGSEGLSSQGRSAGTLRQKNINGSFSFKPAKKLDISGSADIGQRYNNIVQKTQSRTFLPGDTILQQTQYSDNNTAGNYARINTRAVYNISKHTLMNASLSLNLAGNQPRQSSNDTTTYNDIAGYSFSRNTQTTSNDDNNSLVASLMLQRNSKKEGRNFVVRYNVGYTTNDRLGQTETGNQYPATGITSYNNTTSSQKGNNLTQTIALKGAEPISERSLISAEYSLQLYNSRDMRDVTAENNMGSYRDSVQSNDYAYDFNEHNIGLQYQYNYNNTTINLGIRAQPFDRRNRELIRHTDASYNGVNYFPLAGFRYQFSKRWRMDANYNGSMRAPSITQVQPAPDYSDSLSITIGNPNLKPEVSSSFNLSANYLHPVKERSLWLRLNYNRTDDRIVNNSTISANKRITMPVNADGTYAVNTTAGYSMKWKKKYRLKGGLRTGLGNNITIANNTRQEVKNYYYQPNVSVNMVAGFMETEIDYSLRSSYTTGTAISNNNRLLTHTIVLDSKLNLPGDIALALNISYVSNNGLTAGLDNNFVLANAGVYKGFKKPAGLFIKVQAYDLLNNYPNTKRAVYDNVIEDRSFNRIGRYVLCSLIYRFSHFFKDGSE